MQVIGHRGAAGLELENTRSSLVWAIKLGVDAIEIDIRRTKDGRLTVCHDANLEKMSGKNLKISEHSLSELQKIELLDGSNLLSLDEACDIAIAGNTHLIIELKESGCVRELVRVLKKNPGVTASAASFKVSELALLGDVAPEIDLYVLSWTKALEGIHMAQLFKLDGIGINFWLLNPLTYFWAKRRKLKLFVYTVNRKFYAKMIALLYPHVAVCTDYPQWFKPDLRRPKQP